MTEDDRHGDDQREDDRCGDDRHRGDRCGDDRYGDVYVGADEAGKGPVIGPMVAGAVRADPASLPDGIGDSKRLSEPEREAIDDALRSDPAVETAIGVVDVEEIDDPETDMNRLTVAVQSRALSKLIRDGDRIVVDAGDVSERRFADRLRGRLNENCSGIEVLARHGADDEDPIVGAASIVAKVERDRRVEAIAAEYAEFGPVGSGYPGDRTTRSFLERYLRECGELPSCARRSWSTCDDLLAAVEQSTFERF